MRYAYVVAFLVFFLSLVVFCTTDRLAALHAKPDEPLVPVLQVDDVKRDLTAHVVPVADPDAPGQYVGWLFRGDDAWTLTLLDVRKDDYKNVYYYQTIVKAGDGATLDGILELYYIRIGGPTGKQYLIAANNISLRMALPPKKPTNKSQPAQRPPSE